MTTPGPLLETRIGDLVLKNPVMTASGTFAYGAEFAPYVDLNDLGAVVVKGISLEPRQGNPPPRTAETPCGMVNAIGLENVGLERFLADKLPYLRRFDVPVVVNVLGRQVDDYVRLAGALSEAGGVSAIELNVSCPNVKSGGQTFGVDPEAVNALVAAVRPAASIPLWVKLTPLVTDIVIIGRAAQEAGADAVCVGNTFPAMAIDVHRRKPKLGNVVGGLSGPAIRPIMVRLCWLLARSLDIPVIGIGGVMCADDALEYLLAGARAVQVGTANFVDPRTTVSIVEGLRKYLAEQGVGRVDEIVGQLRLE
ncbi:MAG: dihydroorotate dehydrogenase [Deltaproteobacteria bacterium]|nr:dihydroorotate dehydrogenase [Deltaproteobacteria bacterium]